jgi:hypothetical protein
MTNFYTKNDWDTVFCWAVDSLCDDKEVLLDLIGDDDAFTRLYYESYHDCGSGVSMAECVWHCGRHGLSESIVNRQSASAFDLIERLINHFADGGLDLLRLGDSEYVFKFYTDKLVEAVYEDLCEDNNKGLKALIDDDDDDNQDGWSVLCYNPEDDHYGEPEKEEKFENTDLGKEKAKLRYDNLVDSGLYGAIELVHYVDGDGDHVSTWERDGDEESSELYKVTIYDGGDKYNHVYFNNLQEATSHYHVTSGWHVSLTTGELDSPIIMEKDEDED